MVKETYIKHHLLTDSMFSLVVLIAASNYIVCKWALEWLPPFTLMSVRYLLAIAVMTALIVPRFKTISKDMLLKSLYLGLILSAAVVCWQCGIYQAEHIGPSAFIVSLDGLMVPVFAAIFLGQKLQRNVLVAIPVAITGLAMLNLHSGVTVAESDIWFFVSAIGFALHIMLTHKYSRLYDAMGFAWAQMLVCGLVSLVAAYLFEREQVSFANIAAVKYEIAYLAIIATALRFSLQNFAQKRATAATAGFLFTLEPIVVGVLAWFVLSESLNTVQILGSTLIFMAMLYARNMLPSWNSMRSIFVHSPKF